MNRQLILLWLEFLPLSLSDVTMALGDPLTTTTLAHLPNARTNIAAVGVAKSIAIFCESPIIMLLHASNALAPTQASRRALWKFTLIASGLMSLLLAMTATPLVFTVVGERFLGVDLSLSGAIRSVIAIAILWPFAIGWRRYFQGLLIHHGQSQSVAQASIIRLLTVGGILAGGFGLQISGTIVAGMSLVCGVIAEAISVTYLAKKLGVTKPPTVVSRPELPQDLAGVWKFYVPLGGSMMLVWGARVVLVGFVARATDGAIALAAWPAAWGLVLVIANSTRMVQQIIIRNRKLVPDRLLITFAISVGIVCSLILLIVSTTPASETAIGWFVGKDAELIQKVHPVLSICAAIPLFVALQNAIQGFLVSEGRTWVVNQATWVGSLSMLAAAYLGISSGRSGAIAAAIGMSIGSISEIIYLVWCWRWQGYKSVVRSFQSIDDKDNDN
jgi:O-antigen/teichoic acid export membrane protein